MARANREATSQYAARRGWQSHAVSGNINTAARCVACFEEYIENLMRSTRRVRLITVCLALLSMFYMQLAVATYVCPASLGSASAAMSAAANAVDMSHCDGMDQMQAGLCHVHAYGDLTKQSVDSPDLPSVHPFVPGGLLIALDLTDLVSLHRSAQTNDNVLTRTTAPPLAIRHCCFRI